MRRAGNSKPELRIAARTRSRASRTAASASPTMRNVGQPRPDVDLDPDGPRIDAVDGERGDASEHERHATASRRDSARALRNDSQRARRCAEMPANRAQSRVPRHAVPRVAFGGMSTDLRHRLGRVGEQLAAEHLERRGFAILARNHRTRWGELDLIAADDAAHRLLRGQDAPRSARQARSTGCARRSAAAAADGRRLAAGAADRPRTPELRFDAIGVTIDAYGRLVALEHLEGAF